MWRISCLRSGYTLLHGSQTNGASECRFMWKCKLDFVLKQEPHSLHLNRLSVICLRLWVAKWLRSRNAIPHTSQGWESRFLLSLSLGTLSLSFSSWLSLPPQPPLSPSSSSSWCLRGPDSLLDLILAFFRAVRSVTGFLQHTTCSNVLYSFCPPIKSSLPQMA